MIPISVHVMIAVLCCRGRGCAPVRRKHHQHRLLPAGRQGGKLSAHWRKVSHLIKKNYYRAFEKVDGCTYPRGIERAIGIVLYGGPISMHEVNKPVISEKVRCRTKISS